MDITIDLQTCRRTNSEMKRHMYSITSSLMELDIAIIELKTIDDTAVQTIVNKLKKKRTILWEDVRKLETMSNALEQVVDQYERTERKIEEDSFIDMAAKKSIIWGTPVTYARRLPMPVQFVTNYFN